MKKIILSFIIIFLILIMPDQSIATTATVNATAVRVRETASTNSNIITNVYQDDEVEILEENGEWYKVKVGENVGFAKAEFFTKKTEQMTNTTTQNTVSNETNQQNANTQSPATNVNVTQNEVPSDENLVPNQDNPAPEFNIGDTMMLPNNTKIRFIPNLAVNNKTEIAQGTNVSIEAKLGNWYKIASETVSGWVTKAKLEKDSTPTTQPSTQPTQPNPEPEKPEPTTNTTPAESVVPQQPAEKPKEPAKPAEAENTTNKTAIVMVETARVRKSASKSSEIIDVLDEDDVVTITGEEGDFYKITCSKISSGYISKSLVKQKDVTSRSATEERASTVNMEPNEEIEQPDLPSVTGNDIVAFAKQYLGYPYVLGKSTPEKGFDCSGFTRYVFGHFGFALGQVAADQTSLGETIERANLQTGDLILFYNDGKTKIGHCGIFISGGDFIHSANPQRGVVMDNLNSNSYYSERFVTARRIAGG